MDTPQMNHNPKSVDSMQRALHLAQSGQLGEAEAIYRQLISDGTDQAKVYGNLAAICQMSDRHEEGLWLISIALNLAPNDAKLHFNLGVLLGETGQMGMAAQAYEHALSLCDEYPEVRLNLAYAYFHLGEYQKAWPLYDQSRFLISGAKQPYARPDLPLWSGETLSGQDELLLVGEQGLGDVLQFLRFAPLIRQWTQRLAVCVPEPLIGLVELANIADRVLGPQEVHQCSQGAWFPLLSIPNILGTGPDHPGPLPVHLKTEPDLDARWHQLIQSENELVIGINWQGNPETERSGGLRGRSLPLSAFAPLATIPGVRLLSLQKGPGSEQLDDCPFVDRFVACQAEINETWDFCETASIIRACHLVVSSDTCVAHLAGGLGHPVWALLQKIPDWRWGLEGEHCFWYPGMRLFRQDKRGDWNGLMRQIRAELELLLKSKYES